MRVRRKPTRREAEWLADVRFCAHGELKSDIAPCLFNLSNKLDPHVGCPNSSLRNLRIIVQRLPRSNLFVVDRKRIL